MIELLRKIFRQRQVNEADYEQMLQDLAAWSETELGKYLVVSEQEVSNEHLAETAGYRAMLLKVANTGFNLDSAPQLHKFTLSPTDGGDAATLTDLDALPLPSDVVELGVLHHVLDCAEFPHEALKESARVVQASGHLIIIGYNPWSLFGLWRLFGRMFSKNAIWKCRCLSVGRVADWLKLVGFQAEKITYGSFRPPFKSARLLSKLGLFDQRLGRPHFPFGNFYVITARKIRLRPIRGKQEWLVKAMKPVRLTSRTQANKENDA